MKKTINLLKDAGVIDKLQKHFNECKPPKGTSHKTIIEAIKIALQMEAIDNDDLSDMFIDALLEDVSEAIRKEISIEFVEDEEFLDNSKKLLHELIDELFNMKGAGEE